MAWSSYGVTGAGDKPEYAGLVQGGTLLVCGSGRTLWEDLKVWDGLAARVGVAAGGQAETLCCNFAGCHFPGPFRHWASMHPEHLPHWRAIRARDWPGPYIQTHAPEFGIGVDHHWPLDLKPGCSGLFGALIGLAMGYDRIVLAGVPEDDQGHFYDPPGSRGTYMNAGAIEVWEHAAVTVFMGRVTSLSGNTSELLGYPSAAAAGQPGGAGAPSTGAPA